MKLYGAGRTHEVWKRLEADGNEGSPVQAAIEVVVAKARRRRSSAEYKARILREAEACAGSCQIEGAERVRLSGDGS